MSSAMTSTYMARGYALHPPFQKRGDLLTDEHQLEFSWSKFQYTLPGHVANKIGIGALICVVSFCLSTKNCSEFICSNHLLDRRVAGSENDSDYLFFNQERLETSSYVVPIISTKSLSWVTWTISTTSLSSRFLSRTVTPTFRLTLSTIPSSPEPV